MTDRTGSFTVILDKDMRTDDAEELVSAIMLLKNVNSVQMNIVENITQAVADSRAQSELMSALFEVVNNWGKKKK